MADPVAAVVDVVKLAQRVESLEQAVESLGGSQLVSRKKHPIEGFLDWLGKRGVKAGVPPAVQATPPAS